MYTKTTLTLHHRSICRMVRLIKLTYNPKGFHTGEYINRQVGTCKTSNLSFFNLPHQLGVFLGRVVPDFFLGFYWNLCITYFFVGLFLRRYAAANAKITKTTSNPGIVGSLAGVGVGGCSALTGSLTSLWYFVSGSSIK